MSEQFFALLTLALELNVSESKFAKIESKESDQNSLIEYEEIVLKSGLPMNEIWLRVEKLRQNYYFLPCPMDRSCSDPQRVVLNEDIYHYIYPLSNRDYAFNLVIIVLRLLKIPLFDNCRLKASIFNSYDTNCDNICDFDCIEEITPIFLHRTIFSSNKIFDDILWGMIRDFSIGPSYITTHIGHELYIKYLSEVLLQCAESFSHRSEQTNKRNIFVLLLLRLERIVMAFDVYMNKWNNDKTKKLRTKIKNLLKREENRNCLVFYVEFAQIEYDLKRIEQAEHICIAAISQSNPTIDDDCTRSEYWYGCVSLVEMMIREQNETKALNLLNAVATGKKVNTIDDTIELSEATNLLASKKLDDRLKDICFIERNVAIMDIVQSFQPDYLICVIKANIYHKILWRKSKDDAVQQVEILLKTFPEKNDRHEFIREQLYEIYADLMMYKLGRVTSSITLTAENATFLVIKRGIYEFPTNMHLLKCAAMCHNQPWHRIRALLIKHHSPIAIMFLVVAAQFRYKKYIVAQSNQNQSLPFNDLEYLHVLSPDVKVIENAYKTRVTNLLKKFTDHDAPTRKNSLLWRLYLRSLLDVSNDFEKCRNILLTALNECPWNKVSV